MATKLKKKEFPNIYRVITERVISRPVVIAFTFFFYFFLILLLTLSLTTLIENLQTKEQIDRERNLVSSELRKWESIEKIYPENKVIYLKQAELLYRMQEYEKARLYLDKSLNLDPEYSEALELEAKLTR